MMRVVGTMDDQILPTCLSATCGRHVFWVIWTGVVVQLLYYYCCLDTSPSVLLEA